MKKPNTKTKKITSKITKELQLKVANGDRVLWHMVHSTNPNSCTRKAAGTFGFSASAAAIILFTAVNHAGTRSLESNG